MIRQYLNGRLLSLVFVLIGVNAVKAESYEALLGRIDKAVGNEDWPVAEKLIGEALDREPANPSNYLLVSNLGTVCRRQGKLNDALKNYDLALAVAPKSTTILHNRAALLLEMDSVRAALSDYERLLAINPSDCEAMNGAGMIALELGDMQRAENYFLNCLKKDAGNMDAKRGEALLLRLKGDYDRAIALYDGIIKKENRCSNYLNRAECYIAIAKYQEARSDLSEAQKLDPESSDLYLLKAKLAQLQFCYDDACVYAKEALRLGCEERLAEPYIKTEKRK